MRDTPGSCAGRERFGDALGSDGRSCHEVFEIREILLNLSSLLRTKTSNATNVSSEFAGGATRQRSSSVLPGSEKVGSYETDADTISIHERTLLQKFPAFPLPLEMRTMC